MRICLFTPTFLPRIGGTEIVTDALARHFQAAGHHAVVLTRGPAAELEAPYPVVWHPRTRHLQWLPERTARHLRRVHDAQRFDVVAVNYAHPNGYGAVRLGQKLGLPVVVISHGGDLYVNSKNRRRRHTWKRIVYTYQNADALVAISAYTEQLIRAINPAPRLFQRIPNGIDPESVTAPASKPADFDCDASFCLCLGSLTPQKRVEDAIDAFARVAHQLDHLQLVIVGKGKLEASLRERAAASGANDRIHWLGQRTGNDKRWLMQQCAFGVMPSREEGHPIVGLEFLAAGKPIVCTDIAAFDGMFDSANSLRVPVGDVGALADALRAMHTADREAMGAASLSRLEPYRWPVIAEQYVDLFRAAIEAKRGAAPSSE